MLGDPTLQHLRGGSFLLQAAEKTAAPTLFARKRRQDKGKCPCRMCLMRRPLPQFSSLS